MTCIYLQTEKVLIIPRLKKTNVFYFETLCLTVHLYLFIKSENFSLPLCFYPAGFGIRSALASDRPVSVAKRKKRNIKFSKILSVKSPNY